MWLGLRKAQFDNTLHIIDRIEAPEARSARFNVRRIMAEAQAKNDDFEQIAAEDRSALVGVGHLFGVAGLLARRRRIDRTLFLQSYANTLITNFERLEPFIRWRDRRFGDLDTLWREYELFVAYARRWRARRHRKSDSAG